MEQNLEIRVLGDLLVQRGGKPVTLPPSKKTRALLAFLALSDRPVRRERLCEMFWDVPDDPRGALRWSLSKIRQIVNADGSDILKADRNAVLLKPGSVACDARRVSALDGEALSAAQPDELEVVCALFRGRFIDDLALPRCPEFESWRTARADEMEFGQVKLLRTLVDKLADDPKRALIHARALLALRPDDTALNAEVERIAAAARKAPVEGPPVVRVPDRPTPAKTPAAARPIVPGPAASGAGRRQEVRFCTTADGVRIAYSAIGEGPPIVRAAHWMSHLEYDFQSPVWRHWMDALSERNRLVRYDERGNGLSDRDVDDLSFEAMVADLEAIVDAADIERFTLLGMSQGTAISVEYAARHPERVAGLVLYGGYAQGWRRRGDPDEIARREAMMARMVEGWGSDDPLFRQLFAAQFIPGGTQEQMDWFNELQRMTVSPEVARALLASFSDIDVLPRLSRVTAPTIVLHSRHESGIPFSCSTVLAEGIAGARFVALDSANHILLADEPAFARFVAEVRAFLDEVERPVAPVLHDRGRKQITALAAEMLSPLMALDTENPEAAMQVLDPLFDAACRIVEQHGGTVTATDDYVLTAVWGAPLSTEDHALKACRAGLELKRRIDAMAGEQARVRIALDTGDAIVRPRRGGSRPGFEAVGNVMRRAAQLMRSLRRDVVAATSRTREAAGGIMRAENLDTAEIPGLSRGERVYEIVAENRALSRWHLRSNRGLTRLVGREMELIMLRQAWRRAREGHGQVVGIVADPGVGKSRLAHEFLATESASRFTLLECGALQFDSNISFRVIKTLMRGYFGLDEATGDTEAAALVERKLAGIDTDLRLAAPLCDLLELPVADSAWSVRDAADRTAAVRDTVQAVLQLESRKRPVLLLAEDLHWIDAESEAVLGRIVDGMGAQRLMLVATYRPEYTPAWSQKGLFQQIRLDPLNPDETGSFLQALLGADPSVDHLRPLLMEKSDGTPLFLEEMVRALAETGELVGEPGRYVAPAYVDSLQIPASVKPVIAERIDRLPANARVVLQVAAVIGKDIPRPVLEALAGLDHDALGKAVAHLTAVDLLYELQSYPEVVYTFKHALTHDVAYESLLAEDRKSLHERALATMEQVYAGNLAPHVEKLADHALRAESWELAANYLRDAADRALDRCAFPKAARFLEHAVRAVDRLERTPETTARAIDIRTRMRPALEGVDRYGRALELLAEAERLATASGDRERLSQVLLHQSYAFSTHGRLDEAIAAADRLKAVAEDSGDPRYAAEADLAAAQGHIYRNEATKVVERLRPHHGDFTGPWRLDRFGQLGTRAVFYLGHLAVAEGLLGNVGRALDLCDDADLAAAEVNRPTDRYAAALHRARVMVLAEPDSHYERELAEITSECRERAPAPFYPWLLTTLGHAQLVIGRHDAGLVTLAEAIAATERSDMPHFNLYARALVAWARVLLTGSVEGSGELPALCKEAERAGDPFLQVRLLRAEAETHPPRTAIARLEAAVRIAVAQGYRAEEAAILAALADRLETIDPARAASAAKRSHRLFAETVIEGDAGPPERVAAG